MNYLHGKEGLCLLFLLFVFLRGIDTSLTQYALSTLEVKELNPLARLFHRLWPGGGLYLYFAFNTAWVYGWLITMNNISPVIATIIMTSAVAAMMYVVNHNLSVIQEETNVKVLGTT